MQYHIIIDLILLPKVGPPYILQHLKAPADFDSDTSEADYECQIPGG